MRLVRRLALIAGVVLAVPLLLVAIAFGLAQTETGKAWIAERLESALASPDGTRVEIIGLSGLIPVDLTVDRLTLADRAGRWASIEGAQLALRPLDLLAGRLDIRIITARLIRIARQPVPSESTAGSTGFSLPQLPVAVRLEALQLERIELGAPVLGEPAALSLTGSGALDAASAAASLALRRIDGGTGHADLQLAFDRAAAQLRLRAEAVEPSGLLLDALLARSDHLPLQLELAGNGAIGNWQGRLAITAGDQARIEANLAIMEQTRSAEGRIEHGGYRVTLSGSAAAARLLPPGLAALVGPTLPFGGRLAIDETGRLALDGLELDAALGKLAASGSFDPASGGVSGQAEIILTDLKPLGPLLNHPVAGAATLRLALSGTRIAPRLEAHLSGTSLALDAATMAEGRLDITAQTAGDPADPATPVTIGGSGRFAGIAANGMPPELGKTLDLGFAARAVRATRSIAISNLTLTAPGVEVAGNATEAAGAATAHVKLTLTDLARFRALANRPVAGALVLDLDLERAATGAAKVTVDGTADRLAGLDPILDRALGAALSLKAELRRGVDGAVSLSTFALKAPLLTVDGSAELPPALDQMSARYRLELPNLQPLGVAAGTALGGRVTVAGTVAGSWPALAATATLEGDGLAVATTRLDRVTARLDLAHPDAPSGKLEAEFRAGAIAGSAGTEFALAGGNELTLSKLRLVAGESRIEGSLRVLLDRGLATGTLDGRIVDLKPWSALAGAALSGSLSLTAKLDATRGQTADLSLTGSDLSFAAAGSTPSAVRKLSLEAHLAQLRDKPTGKASLALEAISFSGGSLATLRLSVQSSGAGRFGIDGETHGVVGQKLALQLAGDAAIGGSASTLRLTRLGGALGPVTLRLERSLTLERKGDDLAFRDLALGLGSGEISGDGSVKGAALALRLTGRRLPVDAFARLAGHQDVAGALGFEASLSGTRARPEGRLTIDAAALHFVAPDRANLPPIALAAEAVWRDQRVEFRGHVAGAHEAAIAFTGAAPLRLDQKSLAVTVPPDGAVAFKVNGRGDLGKLAELLPIGEDRIAGKYAIDVGVSGTVASPRGEGRLAVTDGRYESLAAGSELSGLRFELRGDRDRFVLSNFAAGDGGQGHLTAAGWVELAGGSGPTLDFNAELTNFKALRSDLARATTSGTIKVAGSLATPQVTAAITVSGADIAVPSRLPTQMEPVNAVIIDSATGPTTAAPPAAAPAGGPVLVAARLDIRVDAPRQIFVRGRGLDSEWRGHLQIGGTSAAPQINGALEVVRGSYSFLGKTFTLSRGAIEFTGGTPPDPSLDIVAQASSSDVTAQVRITGRATAPKIRLSSIPELPQDEILSRVLFGTSVSQITPAQGIQLAQAAAALAGGGDLDLLSKARQKLGLDVLGFGSSNTNSNFGQALPTINSTPGSGGLASGLGMTPIGSYNGASGTGTTDSGLNAGKYVTDRVYVGVTQGLDPGSSRVTVNIELTPHISVQTDAGQTGDAGIGVDWKLDY